VTDFTLFASFLALLLSSITKTEPADKAKTPSQDNCGKFPHYDFSSKISNRFYDIHFFWVQLDTITTLINS